MPRVKSGEMSLNEIRNLARQHNKASQIKDIDKLSRARLMKEIETMGYRVDHVKKRIIKRTMTNDQRKAQNKSVSDEGERKPQKRTKKKTLIAGGEAPPMVKPSRPTKKGNARKGKPVGSRLAFDDTKQEADKKKKIKMKPPSVKEAVAKQKKKKEELAAKRKELSSGYS